MGANRSLTEDFSSIRNLKNNWLLIVGGILESSCNYNSLNLYFPCIIFYKYLNWLNDKDISFHSIIW